jgi:hypothetical protein
MSSNSRPVSDDSPDFTTVIGHTPQVWHQEILTRDTKKALLRCLIDKVVIHRPVPHSVQTRIVWRGGDITTLEIPVTVGSFADLPQAEEMEQIILEIPGLAQLRATAARPPSLPSGSIPGITLCSCTPRPSSSDLRYARWIECIIFQWKCGEK